MKYYKKYLQVNTRPKISFDDKKVCFTCRYQEKMDHQIDRDNREKDSTFQPIYVKEKLGLNCLLVNLAPDVVTKEGARNQEN